MLASIVVGYRTQQAVRMTRELSRLHILYSSTMIQWAWSCSFVRREELDLRLSVSLLVLAYFIVAGIECVCACV